MSRTLDRMRAARRDQSGFTLIELLIVIIILGVLAAIVVFSVRGISNNSDETACKTEVRTVETAIEAYYADRNSYPATVGVLKTEGFLRDDPSEWNITASTTINGTTGALPAAATTC